MQRPWFKKRYYKHFDIPVNEAFAQKVRDPNFVKRHAFTPLIKTTKEKKIYKFSDSDNKRKISKKIREIMYASHRDACILSYYSYLLNNILESFYNSNNLYENVAAYRPIGKSNYDFCAEAQNFLQTKKNPLVMAFDIIGFFDNINHLILKQKMECILSGKISDDWYKIFKFITQYTYVNMEDLKKHDDINTTIKKKGNHLIATVKELKGKGISFHKNQSTQKGIPQGTPISAALSNLYMIDFDKQLKTATQSKGAFYRRYSDDILIICDVNDESHFESEVARLCDNLDLQINTDKTEKTYFNTNNNNANKKPAQYLGFYFDINNTYLRHSSISRQWRKLKRAIRRAEYQAAYRKRKGITQKPYTKKLRKRFTAIKVRNFSTYARRASKSFHNGKGILKQVRRFEKAAGKAISNL